MQIQIKTNKFVRFLSLIILGLLLASMIGQVYQYFISSNHLERVIKLFFVDAENNIPSTYSSLTLILSSVLLAVIAVAKYREKDSYALYWKGLSLIFLYLSIDEAASIHEISGRHIRSFLGIDSGIFYFAWVIPAAVLVFIFILVYLRFLFSLPTKTRVLFIVAGIIFISGALGVESIGGWYSSTYSKLSFIYVVIATIEEALEMFGILLFNYALLEYISADIKYVQIFLKNK